MIGDELLIHSFQPLWLTIDNMGPFRNKPYEIDFTDAEDQPCNLFLLMSKNGLGKTTILEAMQGLMAMLAQKELHQFGHEDIDKGKGRVQWDLRVTLEWSQKKYRVIFSLIAGTLGEQEVALKIWSDEALQKYAADSWHRLGFQRRAQGYWTPISKHDELVEYFLGSLRDEISKPLEGFEEPVLSLPTLLYFSAYRNIEHIHAEDRMITKPERWGYYPVHEIGTEGKVWTRSLDNLLVWMKWLDDGRFERAVELVNQRLFEGSSKFIQGIRRDTLEAIVNNEGSKHRLDRLSSGEKNLVQMLLSIGAHMTLNTLIVIDEVDVHLHTIWQHGILNILKKLVKDHPGVTVIASSHSREILGAFPIDIIEEGLRKGGDIIRTDIEYDEL